VTRPGRVRIGTWNLAGRWSPAHLDVLVAQDCDVWLLTEVRADTALPGYHSHVTTAQMARRRHWAGVFSRSPLTPLPDPHVASAAAVVADVTYCSSILPWRSCGPVPWGDGSTAERTARALDALLPALPRHDLVWGGDWNHSLVGREWSGSKAGRVHIEAALDAFGLQVPTRELPHRIDGIASIDHIAVPRGASVTNATRVSAVGSDGRLSDHDAYAVEIG